MAEKMPVPMLIPMAGKRRPAMKGADDADHDIPEQTEAASADDQTGKPACNRADDQEYQNAFNAHESPSRCI
ncbi:hypothetical protein JOH52_000589 [Sinorhizobium meliloti]|nr:hypothetical protein [Sinorhizobium meliloti]